MENASKALLIAGSILIAILLIAMGVKVFTSTQGTTDQTEKAMQSTEVAMFNSKFTQYAGENKRYAQVRALLDIVSASNSTSNRKISVYVGPSNGEANKYELPSDSGGIQNALDNKTDYSFRIFIGNGCYNSEGFLEKIYIRYKK